MEEKIIDLFKLRRKIEASARILRAELLGNTQAANSEKSKHLLLLERKINFSDSLLMVANEDQAYVIRRHLIDGVDWPRVTVSYNEAWGPEYSKSERTLKAYQQKGLQAIVRFLESEGTDVSFL